MLSDFKPGDSVKINPSVYDYKWDGWKELWNKYGHHNMEVDRIVDMEDVAGQDSFVVVGYPYRYYNKQAIRPDYLLNCSRC